MAHTAAPALAVGDKVTLNPRADGVPHRDGNDAVWEVLDVSPQGLLLLHLVGAPAGRTAGALPSGVTRI